MTGHTLGGRYELGDLLGSGGMAQVYRARDRLLDRDVAVKLLRGDVAEDPSRAERLLREARAAARFSHPNAVVVYDTGEHDGAPYIVMELVRGSTLAKIAADGPLDPDHAVRLLSQVLDALGAAHAAGLVHRDVKPGNVLVTPEGTAKLADFGIARELQAGSTLTASGQLLGTPTYLAPEQVSGQPASPASDLYAAGVVAYELLAGQPPFSGDTPISIALAHQSTPPPPLDEQRPDLPAPLVDAVHHALRKDPSERFADAAGMRVALQQRGGPAATTQTLDTRRGSTRHWWPAAAAAAVVLLAGLVGLAALSAGEADDDPTGAAPTGGSAEEPAAPAGEPAGSDTEDTGDPAPDTLDALIASLAADPAAAGEKGEDLFDLLVEVSREDDDQAEDAREAIEEIADWVDDDELDGDVGAQAIELLEPLAEPPDRNNRDDNDDSENGNGKGEGKGRGKGNR